MTIIELLEKVGPGNCQVQFIQDCVTGAKLHKREKCAEISFVTDAMTPDDLMGRPRKIGMIVWVDADKWPDSGEK